VKLFAAKVLRGFAYVWFAIAFALIAVSVGFEFYRGGLRYGYEKVTEWFSPFNVYGLIANVITFGLGLIAFWGSEKLRTHSGQSQRADMKKQKGLPAELNKAGLGDLVADYAELGLDRLLEEGILRELPGVKTFIGLIRTYRTARDHLFFKKIKRFAESLDACSDEQREDFARRTDEDPKYRERVTDSLLLLLEQLDDVEKAVLLARAFTAFVRGDLKSFYYFQRYGEIIKAANVTHLHNFYQTTERDGDLENPRNFVSDQVLPLVSLGLVEPEPESAFRQNTARRGFTCFVITDFGAKFIRTVIRKGDIETEDQSRE
jgi:hypothetical protein